MHPDLFGFHNSSTTLKELRQFVKFVLLYQYILLMEKKLEKKPGAPYYLQLKDILKALIQSGDLKEGRIPPVRQLAREYGVSINTALRAYESLRREGLVAGAVGRGTFVTTHRGDAAAATGRACCAGWWSTPWRRPWPWPAPSRSSRRRWPSWWPRSGSCCARCAWRSSSATSSSSSTSPTTWTWIRTSTASPCCSETCRRRRRRRWRLWPPATSWSPASTTSRRCAGAWRRLGKPIVGISLEPEMGTIIRIAKIPKESTVGLVTTSEDFRAIIREILASLDLRFARILETTSRDDEEVRELARQCDALLVSPQRRQQVSEAARPGAEVIEFVFTPDRTSVNNLKVALLELQKGGSHEHQSRRVDLSGALQQALRHPGAALSAGHGQPGGDQGGPGGLGRPGAGQAGRAGRAQRQGRQRRGRAQRPGRPARAEACFRPGAGGPASADGLPGGAHPLPDGGVHGHHLQHPLPRALDHRVAQRGDRHRGGAGRGEAHPPGGHLPGPGRLPGRGHPDPPGLPPEADQRAVAQHDLLLGPVHLHGHADRGDQPLADHPGGQSLRLRLQGGRSTRPTTSPRSPAWSSPSTRTTARSWRRR